MYSGQPYSLQNNVNLNLEEDWTTVKDLKEKKRIQNRHAQRKYRRHTASVQARDPRSQADMLLGERMKARLENLQSRLDCHERARLQPSDDQSHALSGSIREGQPKNRVAVHDRTLDIEEAASLNTIAAQKKPVGELHRLSRVEQATHAHPFTLDEVGSVDFSFHTLSDIWNPEMLTQTPHQTTSSSEPFNSEQGSNEIRLSESKIGVGRMVASQTIPKSPADSIATIPLGERFECILECADDIGFSNFDSLATAYYNESFGDSSAVAYEQRLSRNRRLPKVLADIFQAADSWSEWERRGIQEEILKQTESMVVSEGNVARTTLTAGINTLLDAHNGIGTMSTMQAILSIKRTIQNELPNLWAMMMALVGDSRSLWQSDRSNTVLTVILLLKCSDSMPSDQLMRLLEICL